MLDVVYIHCVDYFPCYLGCNIVFIVQGLSGPPGATGLAGPPGHPVSSYILVVCFSKRCCKSLDVVCVFDCKTVGYPDWFNNDLHYNTVVLQGYTCTSGFARFSSSERGFRSLRSLNHRA